MKKIATIFALLIISVTLAFADLLENKYEYEELFEISKETGKPVLLYFQNNSCGWCKHMNKTTFQNNDVIEFLENNYLFFNINTDEPKYDKINERFKIKAGPVFLILDSDKFIYHKNIGFKDSSAFIKYYRKMLDRKNSLSYYKDKYESGIIDKEFLYDYCYVLHNAGDLDSALIMEYLNSLSYEELFEDKNLQFLFDYVYYRKKCIINENDKEFKFILENWKLLSQFISEEQAQMRLIYLVSHFKNLALNRNDSAKYFYYLDILKNNAELNKYYWLEYRGGGSTQGTMFTMDFKYQPLLFYYQNNYNKEYSDLKKKSIKEIWDDSENLNNLTYSLFQKYDNTKKRNDLLEFEKWIKRSIELDKNSYNVDTYANILFKLENYDKSLEIARESLKLAKEEEVPDYIYAHTERLIEKIETVMKK